MNALNLVSRRTWTIALSGAAISIAFLVLSRTDLGLSEAAAAFLANLPSLVTAGLASIATLWAATRFKAGESLRTQWLLIGAGVAALFLGDATYAFIEVGLGQEVPFPSLADVFYLMSFPLLGAGLLIALNGFRRSLDLRRPLITSALVTGVITAVAWTWLFWPILEDAEATLLEKLLSVFYPVGDFALLIFPALALAVALTRFGVGRLAWPWWWVVGGLGFIAASDTLFALADNAGTYETGSLIDLGWWLGYVVIAVGASLLVDIQRPTVRKVRS